MKQKHRGKPKKVPPVDNSYGILEGKDQVDTSPGQDASRHGMEEHLSNTDAPMNTINGNLNTTSQKQHLIAELVDNNIPGPYLAKVLRSSPGPIEATPLYMEGQPSSLPVNNIHGQAFDKDVSDLHSEECEKYHSNNMDNDFLKGLHEPEFLTQMVVPWKAASFEFMQILFFFSCDSGLSDI
ncbi:hypothetical protein CMV_014911 [Castanea mollissima]|uniref:Uncharacterized protein n=1 Tax=Castanea mollissima TaxID=60419 RepID=A0A8J4QVG8_9ROSI|nr:hypothetical protein CMV_014911 [Castanea mollissima]